MTITTVAAVELLVKRIWHRTKARVWGVHSLEGASPGICTTRTPSPAMRLPQEIVEMIIAHLIKNLPCLHSCSLTCYSWYIAAVPHLHPTLSVYLYSMHRKFRWPNPIRDMHRLGLLPFVKTVRIQSTLEAFTPKQLNHRILPQFSVLTNVQSSKSADRTSPVSCQRFDSTLVTSYQRSSLSDWQVLWGPLDKSCSSSDCSST